MDAQDTETPMDCEDQIEVKVEKETTEEAQSEREPLTVSVGTESNGMGGNAGGSEEQASPARATSCTSPVPLTTQGSERASSIPPQSPTPPGPVPEQPTNLSLQCAQASTDLGGATIQDQHNKPQAQSSDFMFDRFRKWAVSNYGDSGKTKTVTKKKYQRIVRILSGEELPTSDNSKFRFWVKNKGFRLGPPPPDEIGADDQVLYVPTRVHVSIPCILTQHFQQLFDSKNCTTHFWLHFYI